MKKPTLKFYLMLALVTMCCTLAYHQEQIFEKTAQIFENPAQNTPKETPKENVMEIVFQETIGQHFMAEFRNKITGERFMVRDSSIVQIK